MCTYNSVIILLKYGHVIEWTRHAFVTVLLKTVCLVINNINFIQNDVVYVVVLLNGHLADLVMAAGTFLNSARVHAISVFQAYLLYFMSSNTQIRRGLNVKRKLCVTAVDWWSCLLATMKPIVSDDCTSHSVLSCWPQDKITGGERTRVSADTLVKMAEDSFIDSVNYRQIYRHGAFIGDPYFLGLLSLVWGPLRRSFKSW